MFLELFGPFSFASHTKAYDILGCVLGAKHGWPSPPTSRGFLERKDGRRVFAVFFCCVVQISDSFLRFLGRNAQSGCPVDSAKLVGSCVGIADHQGSVSGILARP